MKTAKEVFLYFLKAFIFVATFWLSWIFIFRPLSVSHTHVSVFADAQERQQAKTYSQQLQRADEQLAAVEAQQKRMDALLTQHEQHTKRYESVLQKWEQQTGIRK
ncbi:hypothetical protein [Massilia endophytica]|uniref:hypothetical protein n=1 Tax=Massilia endophytica TaxID=2899220 RepID=UPI001E2BCF3B|nr:hypothetical protein [Massilia endophytica]UGQ45143.1 hypothetical protein LSQ66_15220 [Massilia endophytica]